METIRRDSSKKSREVKRICKSLLLLALFLAPIGSSPGADLTDELRSDVKAPESRLKPLAMSKPESAVQAAILFNITRVLRFHKVSVEESALVPLSKWSEAAASRVAEEKGDRNLTTARAMVAITVLEDTLNTRIAKDGIKILTQSHVQKFCDWLPPHSWPFCD